ncbi:MAG: hypothetical protein ACM3S1_08700 [Hyphomicrobiales bacterium]
MSAPFRFAVESWAPEYGAAVEPDGDEQGKPPEVDVTVERPAAAWAPIAPKVAAPACVGFVDGVQRIDARIWLPGDDGGVRMGICASYAAGLVRCDGRAEVQAPPEHERAVFAPGIPQGIETSVGRYNAYATVNDKFETLRVKLEDRRRELEITVAGSVSDCGLVVLDGSLFGREHVPHAIGYLKSHQVRYLEGPQHAVVGQLAPGERTPVFLTRTTWSRYSWYLRLPGPLAHPWSGIARCEAADTLSMAEVVALADLSAAALPGFASEPHKDPRAPQNLYPIAGLERQLRHGLGDPQLLYRALRAASAEAERPFRSPRE